MKRTTLHLSVPLAAALLAAATTSCTTAAPAASPVVERLGSTTLHYKGPRLDVAVSYRFADLDLGANWLFLDVAVSGQGRTAVEVKRDAIFVRTPDGTTVPLATQKAFGEAYGKLAGTLARADVAREPLDYYPGRRPQGLDFLVAPGSGVSLLSAWVNDLNVAFGRLAFFVPGGVQAGPYELRIDVPGEAARIPFRLGAATR
jgi:hypothetical protein